ncbi:family 3 encapsulin nanocompartment shell protein [Streptomyces sp. NPDC087901]|uniref:family 3 encapsulin nanocompartment shell protein n=1 Tax=Streptomyces sp. NPDC087901 TaxID=3365818 RepID=UPI00380546C4
MTSRTPSTPGEEFAAAYLADAEKAEVHFPFTLTDVFETGKQGQRLTARNLFRTQRAETQPVRSWHETRPPGTGNPDGGASPQERLREASFRFSLAEYGVAPITAWVQIPDGLADEPEGLASFIDRRLMVRLGTAENRALTLDVLRHPDVARLPYQGSYVDGVLAAFNEIEQAGGTGRALMVNSRDYYSELVGSGSLLGDLTREEVKISRHRHVAPGCALVGDFAMAARLLESGRSVIKVAEPPEGTFDQPGTAVCAEVYESVAVQLPTHFFHVVPA